MTDEEDGESTTMLSPDDAFGVVGNDTRMQILQTLGEASGFGDADEALSFSELRDRVGMRDSGQFNYHLDQLTGHFIRKTDDGYELRQAGRRVIEAVLSGAVTDDPQLEQAQVDWPCPYCGAPTKVTYDETSPFPVKPYCTDCAGMAELTEPYEHGQLAALRLAPAGIHGRGPRELLEAAITWTHLECLAAFSGVCPRCSAPIEHSISVCEYHDPADGVCPHCTRSYAAQLSSHCTNCIFELEDQSVVILVFATIEMMAFLTAGGLNPITDPWGPVGRNADEEILSIEPFKAQFTFTLDGDTLTLTVDDDLSVVEVTKRPSSGTE